jgi:hypothetical protein
VAEFGDNQIAARMEAEREARMREGGPVLLKRRGDNSPVVEPEHAPKPIPTEPIAVHNEYKAPEPAQPAVPAAPKAPPRPKPDPSLGPLPGSTSPASIPEPANPGNVMQPLPDNQQPPAGQGSVSQPPGQVIEPLPDNQQPPSAQQPTNTPPPNQPPPTDRPPQNKPPYPYR